MLVAGLVLALVAAAVHVYVFVLESAAWTGSRARRIFGTTVEDARTTRQLAFNQGFYNLFLAIDVVVGVVLVASGDRVAGIVVVLTGTASMLGAGVVLLASDRSKTRPALVQALPPAISILLLVLCLLAR